MTDSDLIELGMLIDTTMSSEGILDDMLVTAVRRLNGQDPDGALQAAYLDRAQDLGCLPAALDALAAEPESAPEPEGGGDVIGPNDPAESGTLVTPSDLLDTAGLFLACVHPGDTLLHHKGRFHSWNTGVWDPAELLEKSYDTITRDLWHWLRACEVPTKDGPPKELLPIPGLVDNVRGALLAKVEVGGETDTWRDGRSGGEHILSVDNGLLDIRTGELMPHTPAYFNTVRVRAAARDVSEEEFLESRWHAFLRSVFEDDDDQIRLLRQWFGYILQPDADLHGILALVGKPRSGKGVLLRALRRLLGPAYASVNSSDFGETFGLAQAIDTRVLALGDLRTSHKSNHAAIAERFLSVSGQDVQNIQRKYISSWCGVLKTKILLASNSIPDLRDESGVLATRFSCIEFDRSFLGKEDRTLDAALAAEADIILHWAIDGARDLDASGGAGGSRNFIMTRQTREMRSRMTARMSPGLGFIRACCELDPDGAIPKSHVFGMFKEWATHNRVGAFDDAGIAKALYSASDGAVRGRRARDEGERVRVFTGIRWADHVTEDQVVDALAEHGDVAESARAVWARAKSKRRES